MKNVDDVLIEELEFSYRTQHYMDYKKIKTLGELKNYTLKDLYKIRFDGDIISLFALAKNSKIYGSITP